MTSTPIEISQETDQVIPASIPKDARGNFIYTDAQIDAYRRVLFHEAVSNMYRSSDAIKAGETGQEIHRDIGIFCITAGGRNGKSALLNRIASGLRPLVVAPPLSMSYPWYDVVEKTQPIELWLSHASAQGLIDEARARQQSLNSGHVAGEQVSIEQALWQVVKVIDDTTLDVSHSRWAPLGFVWRLSVDKVAASQTAQFMVAWHDPSIGRITTLDQLVKEKASHIHKRVRGMQAALDPVLAETFLAEAREKDGTTSRFNVMSVQQSLAAMNDKVQARIAEGKSAIPEKIEIDEMIAADVQEAFNRRDGSGWYSAAPDGELFVHTWRIRRILPSIIDDSIYLDASQLAPAPSSLLV